MIIRPYQTEDFPKVLEIYASSKLDELRFETSDFQLLPLDKDPKRLSELQESDIYVYDQNGVIGYGAVFESEIRAVFVSPCSRGKGIGKALLEFLLSKTSGQASLFVAKTNWPAKALYEKYRFEITDEFLTDYNGTPVIANKMERFDATVLKP